MDTHYHLSIAHYFLLLLLVSPYMHSTTKLCFCLAGDELSSTVKTNSCIDEERQALLIFKHHLVDPSGRLSSWEGHDCCQWKGVSCNNITGHVVKMNLRNPHPYPYPDDYATPDEGMSYDAGSCLGGKLNHSLLSLNHLNYLDLSNNYFEGTRIPKFFGELKSLQYLNLSYASFEGEIPPSLGNLSSLGFLDLNSNFNLSSKNLNWLSHLSTLKYLNLRGVDLSTTGVSWAYDIFVLPSLQSLDLSGCELESQLPASLGMLKSLHNLNLGGNHLWGSIPNSIANLSSLKTLDLSDNNMNGSIPQSMGQLSHLISLRLYGNSWEGIITEAHFINLTRLQHFSVEGRKSLIFNVSYDRVPHFKLQTIKISNCWVSPGFGVWLQSQTKLIDVTLCGNGISEDSILDEWLLKVSSQLIRLNLSYNQFHGNLPSHLKFSNLKIIDLSHNQLEGPLPFWWSTNVSSIDLESNLFSGPIPLNIDQLMPNLKYLYLSENHLNGTIPPSICNMQNLMILSLRSNRFSGEFPHAWSVGSNVVYVDVGHNNLSGNIPTSLGVLSSLLILKLNNNNFGGEIPGSLKKCSSLMSIDLGDNKLSGNIPLWIGGSNVSMMYMLRLRSNYFSGHIPQQLCNIQSLHIIDLSHNSLSGTIPMCLNNLTTLVDDNYDAPFSVYNDQATLTLKGRELVYNKTLMLVKSIDLSSNNLQGEIPKEISSLTLLGTLNLSMNQLTGKILSKVGNLRWLETLDLSHNHLSEQIPQSLSSLTSLSHLNLSYNNLSGRIPLGNQLQTLNDSSIYMANPSLCGFPLYTKCPGDDIFPAKDAKDKNEDRNDKLWFYASVVLGFIVGFWGICGTLILKTSWRYAYFQFFDNIKDKVVLAIVLKVAHFRRMFSDVR